MCVYFCVKMLGTSAGLRRRNNWICESV